MSVSNTGINYGHSSRMNYDECAYQDRLNQSTKPLQYRLDANQIDNCDACLSVLGPRGRYGVSTTSGKTVANSQDLVDVESILSNRNTKASKCNHSGVNHVDVTKYNLQHARICGNYLDPVSSLLSDPNGSSEMIINRFYDLPTPPQNAVYQLREINTQLEARDNYCEKHPRPLAKDHSLPIEDKNKKLQCSYKCYQSCQ